MASENEQDSCETSADIADMIRRAVESMGDEIPYTVSAGTMRRVADRLEAALKRERAEARVFWTKKCRETITEHDRYCSPVGNAAAVREALVAISDALCEHPYDHDDDELVNIANAALSEPPRQCDVGTAEDQFDRFAKHCIDKDCDSCEHGNRGRSLAHCALRWAQTPYEAEEGGAE